MKSKFTIVEAKKLVKKYGWKRKYGYSKRELGVKTSKDPTKRNKKRKKV